MFFNGIIKKTKSKLFSSQLRINMFSGVTSTGANVLLTIVGYPSYLHYLGYEKYGVWLVLSTILTFTQLSNLGIGSAVMKFVAEENGHKNTNGIQNYVTTAIIALLVTGIIALLITFIFRRPIVGLFKLDAGNVVTCVRLLPYMGGLSIYVFIVQIFSATLSGLGRMDLANYCDLVGRIIALAVSISLLASGWGIEGMLLGSFLSYLFIHLSTQFFVRRLQPFHFFKISNFSRQCLQNLLHTGGGMFGSSLVSMLLGPFNKLMLSRYVGVAAVPLYEMSYNGSMLLRNLMEAGFRAISPEISRLSGNMNTDTVSRIKHINSRAVKLVWLYGAPYFALLLLLIDPALKLWLGQRYVDSLQAVFRIMLVGVFISLLCVPSYYVLLGLGRTKQIFVSNAVQSCTNALLIFAVLLLGFKLSVYVVAISVSTGMVLAQLYIVWQKQLLFKRFMT